jgi:hypothetical protein
VVIVSQGRASRQGHLAGPRQRIWNVGSFTFTLHHVLRSSMALGRTVNQKRLGKASPENVGGASPNWRSRAATGRVSPAVLIVPGEALSVTIGHFANMPATRS